MRNVFFVWMLIICLGACVSLPEEKSDLKLWFSTPADATVADSPNGWDDDKEWVKALPLGNGSLGAMVFGDVNQERIQLNEETMWSGSQQACDNPDAAQHLDRIKELLFAGKFKEATELTNRTQICEGFGSGHGNGSTVPFGCYQTLGDLWIDFGNKGKFSDYRRELDLVNAIARVTYKQDGATYQREIFVSQPDQVLVMKLTTDNPNGLSFTCRINRPECYQTHTEEDQLVMSGSLNDGKGGNGLQYMARLKAITSDGKVLYTDSTILVSEADQVLLMLAASTDYQLKYPTYKGRDERTLSKNRLLEACQKSYEELYDRHVSEYSSYFKRTSFDLEGTVDSIPTDVCVQEASEGKISPHLYELLFQYGRYLLISSSRPGTMPANLQGIWANELQTPWNGDYHTDVNVEMNYWPAEVTNLSECHQPLFKLIESLVQPGSETAKVQYHKKGWVVHPITNVWGYTSPGESASWGMHTGAAAWICQHIMEHYRFTGDETFLQEMYPVLKGSVEFYMDWLTEDPKSGKLVSGPAVSPENTFIAPDGSRSQISMGPTHDQQVIWQLFDDFGKASEILGMQDDFVQAVRKAQGNLLESQIGKDGRLMEWAEDFQEVELGHRHISHLFAVHPGAQINWKQTPELLAAAQKSMDCRMKNRSGFGGKSYVGWSSAWAISQYARFQQAEKALESLNQVVSHTIHPNLFTICPPFQIDANFGTTAGIAEMLLQSHVRDQESYIVHLLPALPESWKTGSYSGLKARGGFEVAVEWREGRLVSAQVKSLLGNPCRVLYQGKYYELDLKKGEMWTWKE